ncbi:hypothetical protein F5B22DRAFT_248395 [Xylaria bambusicola]|uniref:uncharacterized protein n=1 Tax=Xylaria bambusicola TaxID=326684 RepID=UPI002008929F|nr:uncharacterized protein F5B22DRAFT_248395 [Xylaria bambusicola]KAI0513313.1 hypothetical protein F5B22DRAFT_248395 [Xylaria bambusicola]
MSSNLLNHASTDGRNFDLNILEKIIHHLLSQELKTVKLISSPWIEVLRTTNDPEIAGPILRRIEDDCAKYEHVMSQSVNQIESVIHRVSSRMLRNTENVNELVRNHRDWLGLGQRISPQVEPVTIPNITYIDLTGPSCRICMRSIEESRATVYNRCGCITCEDCFPAGKRESCDFLGHEIFRLQDSIRIYGISDPCGICHNVLQRLTRLQGCGHLFCRGCLLSLRRHRSRACPTCRQRCCDRDTCSVTDCCLSLQSE